MPIKLFQRLVSDSLYNINQMQKNEEVQHTSPKVPKYADKFKVRLRESSQKYSELFKTSQPEPEPLKPASFFFLRLKSIGVGAHSFVYLVQEEASNVLLAQKAITLEHAKQISEELIREIKIQSYCQHENLIKLFHIYSTPTHIHMVMEYAEDALFQLKQKFKIFKQKQVLEVLRQVLHGLAYLHKRGIVHADVKLQNVMIANGVVKLCDFGYAHREGTEKEGVVGTMEYLSPEYASGTNSESHRDVWAVGIMAFEMLVGRNPFEQLKEGEKWTKLVKSPPQTYLKQLFQLERRMGREAGKVEQILRHIFVSWGQRWSAQRLLSLFHPVPSN